MILSRLAVTAVACVLGASMLAACQQPPSKAEEEAAKNTFACELAGERVVVRFDNTLHEARLLMPDGNSMALHQIPSASGVRFSNGTFELTGKGSELTLSREGVRTPLVGCANLPPPPK
jgi:membrane-bound inhibitor of C-type lysozyme